MLQCSVPEGDLHCQCILSIFPASVHQICAYILVFVNINPFLYTNDQFALVNDYLEVVIYFVLFLPLIDFFHNSIFHESEIRTVLLEVSIDLWLLKKSLLKTSKIVLMYRNSLAIHFSSMVHAKCLLPRLDRLLLVRSCLQNLYQCACRRKKESFDLVSVKWMKAQRGDLKQQQSSSMQKMVLEFQNLLGWSPQILGI